jgi:protein O-GlcNAc transferase
LMLFKRKFKAAEKKLLDLLTSHPDQELIYDYLVRIYMIKRYTKKCEELMLSYLKRSPKHIPYLWALVNSYACQGRTQEMRDMLDRIALSNDVCEPIFREIFAIPAVFESKEHRIEFRDAINHKLDDVIARGVWPNRPDQTFSSTPFYLAYHDELNKAILEKMAKILRQGLITPPKLKKIKNRKKPKIAIISQHFYKHSVMDFYFHTIANLPETFDVTLIYIDPIHIDHITKDLFERADTVLMPSGQHEELIPLIVEGQFDMIIYPEVGMSNVIYYLSMLRLAPIQVGLMGHPETSGSASMDYFVSWKNFHFDQPKKQFTETVVQLEKLPICYDYPVEMDGIKKTRKSLGLPNNHHILFTIPMMLFKIQPEFDAVIIKIIQASQRHRVVLICYNAIEKIVFARLKKQLAKNELEQLIFCLPFKRRDYYALIKNSNVVLESFPFGGGNTVLHAMAAGTPVISLRANQLKGAFGAGYYDYLGETGYCAHTVDEYIQLAIKVANDATVKSRYKAMIQKNKDKLFGNMAGPREFYEWLSAVLTKKHDKALV